MEYCTVHFKQSNPIKGYCACPWVCTVIHISRKLVFPIRGDIIKIKYSYRIVCIADSNRLTPCPSCLPNEHPQLLSVRFGLCVNSSTECKPVLATLFQIQCAPCKSVCTACFIYSHCVCSTLCPKRKGVPCGGLQLLDGRGLQSLLQHFLVNGFRISLVVPVIETIMSVHTTCIDVGNACVNTTATIIARNDIPPIQPIHAFKFCLFKQVRIPYHIIIP